MKRVNKDTRLKQIFNAFDTKCNSFSPTYTIAKGYLTIQDLQFAIHRTCKRVPPFIVEKIYTEFQEDNHITFQSFCQIMDYSRFMK
jgi:hypothetical protein